jgi:hypothetical protein
VLGRDPGGQQALRIVGQVVADERVEQLVVVQVGRGDGDELAIPGRFPACCAARASRTSGSSASNAAATSSAGEQLVVARSRIAAGACASPPISRRSRLSMSSGMRKLSNCALTIH